MSFKILEGLKKGDTVEVLLRGEVTAIGTNRISGDWFDLGDMFAFDKVTDSLVVAVKKVAPPLPTAVGSVVRVRNKTYLRARDGFWHSEERLDVNVSDEILSAYDCEIIYDADEDEML